MIRATTFAAGKRRKAAPPAARRNSAGSTPFTYTIDSSAVAERPADPRAAFHHFGGRRARRHANSTMTLALETTAKKSLAHDSLLKDARCFLAARQRHHRVLTEIVKPRVLFSFKYINIAQDPALRLRGRTFLDAYPIPRTNVAIGVERDRISPGRRVCNGLTCLRKMTASSPHSTVRSGISVRQARRSRVFHR